MKKRLFKRIFLLHAVLLVLAVTIVEFSITSAVRESYLDNLEKSLLTQIDLISEGIPFGQGNLDALCRKYKEKTGARVTIIESDGTVIGDSDTDSGLMENHAGRPEIQQAAVSGSGTSLRRSDTLREDFLYVAQKVAEEPNREGYVRLAITVDSINRSVNAIRIGIVLVVAAVLFATVMLSLWQMNSLRKMLSELGVFSRSLAQGEIGKRLHLSKAGEFSEIAADLNSMSATLQETIRRHEEERNRLNVILQSIPDAVLIMDPASVIQLSSDSSKAFFDDAHLTGKALLEVVRSYECQQLIEEVRETVTPLTSQFRIESPVDRYITATISPFFYGQEDLSGFVAVFHDITQLRKLEEVRKDFIANLSHEIKTPITAIKGFAETLLEGALDDKEHALKFLRSVQQNSERINSLVDDLMVLSRIELGDLPVEKAVLDVRDVIENVSAILEMKAAEKALSLQTFIGAEVGVIEADRDKLIQILTNLVDNAIKFTETGSVVFGADTQDGRTFLFVEDTGVGIPPKHLPRLGERFYRVDPARSRIMGGTGLGLAIVKHLVKAHRWDMQIDSSPGKGTKVRIFT
ncbi:MAG: ATP-binding protein [Chloroflexota bacterium]